MPSDIKHLLDSIIKDTHNSYPERGELRREDDDHVHHHHYHPTTFDKGEYRERLSLYVLKDLVCAMMHDDTDDLDNMINSSIMRHIRDNYNGTCYGYLATARDRLKSPVISDIIQEIDDAAEDVADQVSLTKDPSVADNINVDNILKNVDNYEELREKLKESVSNKVVDDVAKVVTTSNEAPVFDNLDDKLAKKDEKKDTTTESVILRMCGAIVSESAMEGNQISTEEGLNRAIVEYCINEMDFLFKQNAKKSAFVKYLR